MSALRTGVLLILFTAAVGCGGVDATPFSDPVSVTGNVQMAGKPATDIAINFQPTGDGLPSIVQVKDGKFETQITPGKYTWYVSKASSKTGEKTLSKVPAAFQQGSMDRQIEVTAPGPIEFVIN
jgi:hypothetical protein